MSAVHPGSTTAAEPAAVAETEPGAGPLRPGGERTRWQAIWAARWYVLLSALIAAGLAYAASHVVPKRFSSAAVVRVTLPTSAGLSEQSVQAANGLANQYTQVATAGPILARAAATLGAAGQGLGGSVSASTVASQNLVQISARASSPGVAQARANAMAIAFASYLNEENAKAASGSTNAAKQQLGRIQGRIQKLQLQIDTLLASRESGLPLSVARRARLSSMQNEAASLQSLQQSLLVAQVGGGTPILRVFSPAGPGGQTQPRPTLYTVVAFLVVLLIAAQIAALLGTRRGTFA
jgi:capsular polysaccharide biosynthesis protein